MEVISACYFIDIYPSARGRVSRFSEASGRWPGSERQGDGGQRAQGGDPDDQAAQQGDFEQFGHDGFTRGG